MTFLKLKSKRWPGPLLPRSAAVRVLHNLFLMPFPRQTNPQTHHPPTLATQPLGDGPPGWQVLYSRILKINQSNVLGIPNSPGLGETRERCRQQHRKTSAALSLQTSAEKGGSGMRSWAGTVRGNRCEVPRDSTRGTSHQRSPALIAHLIWEQPNSGQETPSEPINPSRSIIPPPSLHGPFTAQALCY